MILKTFAKQAKEIFADKLKGIILFGSYARGDSDEGSDIDVMLLVDIDKIEIKKYRNKIVDIITDLDWNYEIVLAPIIQNYEEFEKYKDDLPFFHNVETEGVLINA